MKDTTLAQGNQIINLILQKKLPAEKLQKLFKSGLFSDLLDVEEPEVIDRKAFRIILGLDGSKKEEFFHQIVLHNLPAERKYVKQEVEKEIGVVKIISWKVQSTINDKAPVSGASVFLPQRDIFINVRYIKK
jgi:hypothetical protein